MVVKSNRNTAGLRREDLIKDYLDISRSRKGALVATALRTRSISMRDILVYDALHQNISSQELEALLRTGEDIRDLVASTGALAELGRLVLLQNILEGDAFYGGALLKMARDLMGTYAMTDANLRTLVQYHLLYGNGAEAEKLLDEAPEIDEEYFGYLRAELKNPFTLGDASNRSEWLDSFNQTFHHHGIAPVDLSSDDSVAPFDRLVGNDVQTPSTGTGPDPLVSIVLTAFKPDGQQLLTSVQSILDQSWKNLELIIVDDASGGAYDALFAYIAQLDERIQVLKTPVNGGTYVARNIGYAASSGVFISGQDDDDWSHPERIQRQVNFLEANQSAIGCRVMAIQCGEDLGRVRLGYGPIAENASSLMLRREGYEQVGGYIEARKAADTEYYHRLVKVTGRSIPALPQPLTIIRILRDSLSRGDFAPGWRHSARRTFRSSYVYWHKTMPSCNSHVNALSTPPVKIPRRFLKTDEEQTHTEFDVVFAGDWQQYGGPQKSMIEEIFALKQANYRVAIMNLEAARFMGKSGQVPLIDPIQRLINLGEVDEVLYDDDVHVRLLVLRYPPILQFMPYEASKLEVASMIVLANQAPSERDGSDIRYIVDDCHRNAHLAFGVQPTWVPQGPQVRELLELYLSAPSLAAYDIPGILNLCDWWQDRLWFRSTNPVVGRHSRDSKMKWPADRSTLLKAYPADGRFDVRIMGSIKTPLDVLGTPHGPPGWVMYKRNEVPVKEFLSSLDYFVFFQHPEAVEAFGRAILEAIGSGVVVILPEQFRAVFGEGAIYCNADEVEHVIRDLHENFSAYRAQLVRSKAVLVDRFSYLSYQKRISRILETKAV